MRRAHPTASLILVALGLGCAVDVSGLPRADDLGTPDIGGDSGRLDLGGLDAGPADLGPSDMRTPDVGQPDLPGCVAVAETCNGEDDDCDGNLDEDIVIGMPCDGNGDGCRVGRTACLGGSTECLNDDTAAVGQPCDGDDADAVAEGTFACSADVLVCMGDCTSSGETCNRRDDDCDGQVDENAVCSDASDTCQSVVRGGSVYLYCTEPGRGDPWDEAQSECARSGYALAVIDDDAERAFLGTRLAGVGWWVAARTDATGPSGRRNTNRWTWRPGGGAVDPALWAAGEPSGDGSCGELVDSLGQHLNDLSCPTERSYICEAAIQP